MEDSIKRIFKNSGADVCGIASIDRFCDAPEGFSPTDVFPECKSVIAFGYALPHGLYSIEPRLVYGHFNYSPCADIDRIAINSCKLLEKLFNCLAVPIPSDTPYEYWDSENMTGKGLISLKHTAVLCGLGNIGKNSLLINPQFGNTLNLGAVLTDLELKSDPLCTSVCIEGCHKCEQACPVHAIQNGSVIQKLCRPNAYGSTARGFDTVDCNKCRVVCPMRFGINQ